VISSYRFVALRFAAPKLRFAELRALCATNEVRVAARCTRPRIRRLAADSLRFAWCAVRLALAVFRFTVRRTFARAAAVLRRTFPEPVPVAKRRAFFTLAATVPSVDPIVRATSMRDPSPAPCDELLISHSLV